MLSLGVKFFVFIFHSKEFVLIGVGTIDSKIYFFQDQNHFEFLLKKKFEYFIESYYYKIQKIPLFVE